MCLVFLVLFTQTEMLFKDITVIKYTGLLAIICLIIFVWPFFAGFSRVPDLLTHPLFLVSLGKGKSYEGGNN